MVGVFHSTSPSGGSGSFNKPGAVGFRSKVENTVVEGEEGNRVPGLAEPRSLGVAIGIR